MAEIDKTKPRRDKTTWQIGKTTQQVVKATQQVDKTTYKVHIELFLTPIPLHIALAVNKSPAALDDLLREVEGVWTDFFGEAMLRGKLKAISWTHE